MTFAEAISKVLEGKRITRSSWELNYISLDIDNNVMLFVRSGPYKLKNYPIFDLDQLRATDWEVWED